MIEKITNQNQIARHKLAEKINELVDAVNTIQKERELERFEIQEWIGILEAVRKSVNIHEKQIDELQMKLEPEKCDIPDSDDAIQEVIHADPYSEQRNWLGCLCRFWFDNKKQADIGILGDIDEDETHAENVPQPIKLYVCPDGSVYDNESVAKSHTASIFNPLPAGTTTTDRVYLEQELNRTRKALDIAVDALGYYASENSWDETNRWMFVENGFEFARDVLVKIDKTLKQKDVK